MFSAYTRMLIKFLVSSSSPESIIIISSAAAGSWVNNGGGSALKLAISEETIGVQTKLQVYDYEWNDYQLNASDYVKERIRIVAGQNLMNITKAFDYEVGGGIHTFQIVFKRNSNKRPSKRERDS